MSGRASREVGHDRGASGGPVATGSAEVRQLRALNMTLGSRTCSCVNQRCRSYRPAGGPLPAKPAGRTGLLEAVVALPAILAWMDMDALPGRELVGQGLADLRAGRMSASAYLVLIGADRLRKAGVEVPDAFAENPEHSLYALLAAEDEDSAHSRYNAMIRQLVSFERAVECAA